MEGSDWPEDIRIGETDGGGEGMKGGGTKGGRHPVDGGVTFNLAVGMRSCVRLGGHCAEEDQLDREH